MGKALRKSPSCEFTDLHGIASVVYYATFQVSNLAPVKLTYQTLNELGKNPVGKVILFTLLFHPLTSHQATVVSLPTIESSYVNHTAKGIQGFDHPAFPALRVALEVLNGTESYLWVRTMLFSVTKILSIS